MLPNALHTNNRKQACFLLLCFVCLFFSDINMCNLSALHSLFQYHACITWDCTYNIDSITHLSLSFRCSLSVAKNFILILQCSYMPYIIVVCIFICLPLYASFPQTSIVRLHHIFKKCLFSVCIQACFHTFCILFACMSHHYRSLSELEYCDVLCCVVLCFTCCSCFIITCLLLPILPLPSPHPFIPVSSLTQQELKVLCLPVNQLMFLILRQVPYMDEFWLRTSQKQHRRSRNLM